MGRAEKIAKMRFLYHCNIIEGVNILSQFGILSGEKADMINKKHFHESFKCLPYMSRKDIRELAGKTTKKYKP